jgi:hypothetical protein
MELGSPPNLRGPGKPGCAGNHFTPRQIPCFPVQSSHSSARFEKKVLFFSQVVGTSVPSLEEGLGDGAASAAPLSLSPINRLMRLRNARRRCGNTGTTGIIVKVCRA